jgi:hypothetical protein
MANPEEIKELIKELNPNAIFIKGFDSAIFGTARVIGKDDTIAAYDSNECIRILIKNHGMNDIEAFEHLEEIITDGKESIHKPIFINDFRHITDVDKLINIVKEDKEKLIKDFFDENSFNYDENYDEDEDDEDDSYDEEYEI